ncbi:membrane bound O-acyl transferase, partial [Paraphysoderma sedebokerense]
MYSLFSLFLSYSKKPFIICSFAFEKIQWILWEHGNVLMYQTIKHAKYTSVIVLLCSLCVAMSRMEKWTPLSFFVTVVTVSVSLKIYSYFRDNDIIRQTHATAIEADEICTVRYLVRFLICPTLIYQNSLKCTGLVKPSRVIYHFFCFIISAALSVVLTVQWSIPIVSSIMGKNNLGANELLMAWLNLSIPVTITWLAGFVGFFHHWCHMAAELTGFPETERHFYLDWWNSSDIASFWRRWNVPVHLFSLRYIYKPLRSSGYSKLHASVIVFFISAILHELVFAVSLNIFHSPIGFIGMFGQIPLQILCKRKAWGEYLVGLMVVLGLSAGVLGYSLAMV